MRECVLGRVASGATSRLARIEALGGFRAHPRTRRLPLEPPPPLPTTHPRPVAPPPPSTAHAPERAKPAASTVPIAEDDVQFEAAPARPAPKAPEPVVKPVEHVTAPKPVEPVHAAKPAEPAAAKPIEPAAAKPAPSVHEKVTSPALPSAVDPLVEATARAVEQRVSGLGLTPAQVEAVTALTRDVVERVVWEVVPQLAEAMIREELKRITSE